MQTYRRHLLALALLCGSLSFAFDAGPSLAPSMRFEPPLSTRSLSPAPPFAAIAQPRPILAAGVPRFERYIGDAAKQHGVSEQLIRAIIQTESEFDPLALSTRGACGLMQLMPSTARSLGVVDCFDARQNIQAGTRYLKLLLLRYEGSVSMSIAAYNAGEGAVARHGGIPPYRQTQAYVRKVTALL